MPDSHSQRASTSAVGRALARFIGTETAGGALMVGAALVGLLWANSPWSEGYERLWHTELAIRVGNAAIELDLRHWINEGLMALFFLVVALEIKREFVEGDLGDRRTAALPIAAAIGGMVVPAVLFLLVVRSGEATRGWGIPMATDIAFALGVMALVGRRLPSSLRLFLLTLAIVDDIGAIVVIAAFYTETVALGSLALAVGLVAVVYGCRRAKILYPPLYVALGIAMWVALHESGVHATLAGVAMGLLAPAYPALDREIVAGRVDDILDVFTPASARETSRIARQAVPEMQWLEHVLHPWTSFLVVPVFALANAGVDLSAGGFSGTGSRVAAGVLVGLLLGKPVGVLFGAWAARRTGLADLPPDAALADFVGVAILTGIGFTVSLFVAGLAYGDGPSAQAAKLAILAASVIASVIASIVLVVTGRHRRTT